MRRFVIPLLVYATLLGGVPGRAEEPAADEVAVALTDGSRLVGRIVGQDDTTLTIVTTAGVEVRVGRDLVAGVGPAAPATAAPSPTPAPPSAALPTEIADPNPTRLMFAPSGRPLRKGDGYFSDHYVIFPGFAYGVTDHWGVAGGFSIVPGLDFDEQVLYVSSTAGWHLGKKTALSLGGLYATGSGANEAGALLFGVGSFGAPDRSLSVGLGVAALRNQVTYYDDRYHPVRTESDWRFRDRPILMLGGTFRVARRLSLVTESWLLLGDDFDLSEQPFGLALRFFGERLSVDVGFVLVADVIEEGLPVPWLSFSYHFGPSRRSSKSAASGGLTGWPSRLAR